MLCVFYVGVVGLRLNENRCTRVHIRVCVCVNRSTNASTTLELLPNNHVNHTRVRALARLTNAPVSQILEVSVYAKLLRDPEHMI